jgi:cytochrome c biogenesis protein CcmG/thiol:disulfide interchange protein DsbE
MELLPHVLHLPIGCCTARKKQKENVNPNKAGENMKKAFLALLVILALIGYSAYNNTFNTYFSGKKEEKAAVGFYAPTFALSGLDGKTYQLSEIKKPVLINFWASWCDPCRVETPHLIKLYENYKGQFEILAVNVTVNDKEVNAKKFVDFFKLPFPVLLDRTGDITEKYQIIGYPTNFFIDKNGKVIDIADGLLPPEEMEKRIKQMIES